MQNKKVSGDLLYTIVMMRTHTSYINQKAVKRFSLRPDQTTPFIILLCLTPDLLFKGEPLGGKGLKFY